MAGLNTTGPGAIRVRDGDIELNADREPDERLELVIVNTGDRPVQIGSHLHLPYANPALEFDRDAARVVVEERDWRVEIEISPPPSPAGGGA